MRMKKHELQDLVRSAGLTFADKDTKKDLAARLQQSEPAAAAAQSPPLPEPAAAAAAAAQTPPLDPAAAAAQSPPPPPPPPLPSRPTEKKGHWVGHAVLSLCPGYGGSYASVCVSGATEQAVRDAINRQADRDRYWGVHESKIYFEESSSTDDD